MSNQKLDSMLDTILAEGRMSEDMFSQMRRYIYGDGVIQAHEADLLFKINDQVTDRPADWTDVFVGAITDFVVRQTPPRGYVDTAEAAWLVERIDHDGVLDTQTEMKLLLNVLHYAESVAEHLQKYAMRQVLLSVLEGRGFMAHERKEARGFVDAQDVENLRAVIYAVGAGGGYGVSRIEAETLFDLDEITKGQDNDPAWTDLFVKAITAHLMMMSAPAAPDYQEALRRETWLSQPGSGIDWNPMNIMKAFKAWKAPAAESEFLKPEAISKAEKIDMSEAAWLIDRLNRDGELSANEQALLDNLSRECPDIHESLTKLMNKAA